MKRLEGKSAIVTGAASGIGRATAKLFAEQGAKVVAVDRAPEVEATVADIRAAGGTALALVRDTSQEEAVADYIETAVRQHGGLDVCFANAGVSGGMRAFDEWTVEEWNRILSINLVGTFLAIKYATRVMVPAGHGSIICTASVAGLRSGAGGPPYSASKAGVISLVQTSANQFGGTGVRINAICPGLIETGMTKPVSGERRGVLCEWAGDSGGWGVVVFVAGGAASDVNLRFSLRGGLPGLGPAAELLSLLRQRK
jgi:NAD(P)-dependent dehydrogenase (short-subunit alcohol dehydrogenase family)